MNLEAATTELLLHNNKRLLTAIQAVIDFASDRAGLPESARRDLEIATSAACREAFSLAGSNGISDPVIKVIITGFSDRVEIAIEHHGETSLVGQLKNIDQIDSRIQGGISRTTLVKYSAASKSGQPS